MLRRVDRPGGISGPRTGARVAKLAEAPVGGCERWCAALLLSSGGCHCADDTTCVEVVEAEEVVEVCPRTCPPGGAGAQRGSRGAGAGNARSCPDCADMAVVPGALALPHLGQRYFRAARRTRSSRWDDWERGVAAGGGLVWRPEQSCGRRDPLHAALACRHRRTPHLRHAWLGAKPDWGVAGGWRR